MIPLPRGLVVSCQGPPGTLLDDPHVMAAMAAAAERAGAIGIRAQGVADIRAIRRVTGLPIIGLLKRDIGGRRWITPTVADAIAIVGAGADLVAVDLTAGPRPDGSTAEAYLRDLRDAITAPILADVSTLTEGIAAADGGAAAVLTTMSGYTPQSRPLEGPDLELVSELVRAVAIPVIAEGRFRSPEQVRDALDRGAHAVVVGTAITNPLEITRWFMVGVGSSAQAGGLADGGAGTGPSPDSREDR
jgi:N-acylglucosamine-6-phosphate 2-epimerase